RQGACQGIGERRQRSGLGNLLIGVRAATFVPYCDACELVRRGSPNENAHDNPHDSKKAAIAYATAAFCRALRTNERLR
ncbi:hypothetical protein SB724_20935, partial [Bacillus sp. SIMBA_031]|uniref:hypothetical protein n=1 Tax=Bacillus sp. SIMBA_031 TaxID=3085774 RepID=UPI00397E0F1B